MSFPYGEDLKFGHEHSLGVIFLKGNAVIRVMNTATHFLAYIVSDSHVVPQDQRVNCICLAWLGNSK